MLMFEFQNKWPGLSDFSHDLSLKVIRPPIAMSIYVILSETASILKCMKFAISNNGSAVVRSDSSNHPVR